VPPGLRVRKGVPKLLSVLCHVHSFGLVIPSRPRQHKTGDVGCSTLRGNQADRGTESMTGTMVGFPATAA